MSYLDYLKNTGLAILTTLVVGLPIAAGLWAFFGSVYSVLSWQIDGVLVPWIGWSVLGSIISLPFTIPLSTYWSREKVHERLHR